jgi:hypothetical protein
LRQDYVNYNEHEQELHKYLSNHSLTEFLESGSRMMMQSGLIPTNLSRVSRRIVSSHLKGYQYFEPQHPFIDSNNKLTEKFKSDISQFSQRVLQPRNTSHQSKNVQHLVTKVPLGMLIDYLVNLEINNKFELLKRRDTLRYLEYISESQHDIWVIEVGFSRSKPRSRTIKYNEKPKNGRNQYKISSLFAGDTDFKDGNVYFGDRSLLIDTNIRSSEKFEYSGEIILQLHAIQAALRTSEEVPFRNSTFYTPALYFPEELATKYIRLSDEH